MWSQGKYSRGAGNTTGGIQTLPTWSRATTFGGGGKGRAVDTKSEGGTECRVVAAAEVVAAEQGGGGLAAIRRG